MAQEARYRYPAVANLALVTGEKEGSDMKSSRSYEDAPAEIGEAIRQAEVIEDFLPPPEQLILKEETVKVTLNLNKESVTFLKEEARVQGVPYQQMIRRIIDLYAQHYRKQMV